MDLVQAIQEGTRVIQDEQDSIRQKMLTMDMEARMLNIKIRGMPEQAESTTELQSFIANQIMTVMHIEVGVALCLTKIYCIGSPSNSK